MGTWHARVPWPLHTWDREHGREDVGLTPGDRVEQGLAAVHAANLAGRGLVMGFRKSGASGIIEIRLISSGHSKYAWLWVKNEIEFDVPIDPTEADLTDAKALLDEPS